ncbi:MAG: DUF2079 domain-containing protein [Leptospiraceae bacterium]|nr:DUF2079 domain-containing protein [Leptospiraceae bacterium]
MIVFISTLVNQTVTAPALQFLHRISSLLAISCGLFLLARFFTLLPLQGQATSSHPLIKLLADQRRGPRAAALMLFAATALDLARILVLVHGAGAMSMDFPIFHESLLNLANQGRLINSIQYIEIFGIEKYARNAPIGLPTLAFHQNFILYIFWPLYRFVPEPHVILQMVPTVCIAISAGLVYLIVKRRTANLLYAFCAMCVFPLLPGMQAAQLGFFPDIFAIPLLLAHVYFQHNARIKWSLLALASLALVRENYFMITMFIGLYQIIKAPSRKTGLVIIGLALGQFAFSFILVKGVFFPAVDDVSVFNIFPAFAGTTVLEKMLSIIANPLQVMHSLLGPAGLWYYFIMLLPFLPWLARSAWTLVALPLLGIIALSGLPYAIDFRSHHSWPIVLILFLGWLDATTRQAESPVTQNMLWYFKRLAWIGSVNVLFLGVTQSSEMAWLRNMKLVSGTTVPGFQARRRAFLQIQRITDTIPADHQIAVPLPEYARFIYLHKKIRIFPARLDDLNWIVTADWITAPNAATNLGGAPREELELRKLTRQFHEQAGLATWRRVQSVELPIFNRKITLLEKPGTDP